MATYTLALGPDDPDDGEEGRRQRGLAIAALVPIRPDRYGYKVPAQSGVGSYLVNLEHGPYCTCPDFEKRELACKHVFAVELMLERAAHPDGPPLVAPPPQRVPLSQPWSAYNAAQVHEGEMFPLLLRELCDTVEQPPQHRGRPRMPLADMVYAMATKVYSGFSTRRAMSDIRDAVAAGRMGVEPSFSTPIRYFENPAVTPVLRELIQRSALPLQDIEVYFAIDSTGFASTAYNRWFDAKWGGVKREVQWTKLHAMCGVQTNIVTVASATSGPSADSPYWSEFVRATEKNFTIREVSGDLAYSSKQNLHVVDDLGGTAFVPFKSNATIKPQSRNKPDGLWVKMFNYFHLNQAEFNRHYHRRSNIETVFYMIKAKFGDRVRAKTPTAQVNEALTKVLCHNISVLVHAAYSLGISPAFGEPAEHRLAS